MATVRIALANLPYAATPDESVTLAHDRGAARVRDLDALGRRLVGPDDHAVADAMRTEHGKGIGVTRAGQRVEFLVDCHVH